MLAAAVGLVGILSVPLLLSRRFSDADRYEQELAQWHVRWGSAASPQERASLVLELEGIKPPAASVTGVERHRRYVRAHQIFVLSERATGGLIAPVRESLGADPVLPAFGCESLRQYETRADFIESQTGIRIEWVARACDVQTTAGLNLGETRSEATVDWLKDEINAIQSAN